jgi:Zn-dependent protease
MLIAIFLAIGVHEYAHCKMADMAGDPTPANQGRVTLNLFKHFDPMGSIMILVTVFAGFGIGWGKPAPMDPRKMNNPKWDFFWAVAAGPISNLIQAVVWAVLFRLLLMAGMSGPAAGFLAVLAFSGVFINLVLALFNLIPFGVLDGHWLVATFMPDEMAYKWTSFNRQYGMIMLIAIIIGPQLFGWPSVIGAIILPPIKFLIPLLTGIQI